MWAKSQTNQLKPFLILWSGQAVSLLGSQLVQFALIWWLTETTGSAVILAMASLVGLLPQVILGPFVGVLVDRWPRRLTMLTADSIVAAATIVLAYLFWIEVAQIEHVFAILFVRALAGAFHWPSMQASTTLMVPQDQLTRIQGLNQTLQGGLNIASAPLGALLLGVLPMQGILAIDVGTALFAIIPLFFIHIPQPAERQPGETADLIASQSSFWRDLRAGLHYVWHWPGLLMLMGIAMMINLVLTPAFSLLPLLVTAHFEGDAFQLGVLNAAFGIGIILGGVLLGVWGGFKRRILTSLVGLLGLAAATLLMGLAPSDQYILAVTGAGLVGVMQSLTNGPILAVFQARIAPDMQGRFFTLLASFSSVMSPLGLVIAGPVADALGVRTWYIIGGIVTAIMAVVAFMTPAIMHIEANPAEAAAFAPEMAEETAV